MPRFFASFIALFLFCATAHTKPNVLFILADDLGWADTTLYGHTSLYETPHLERLAKRGMTFDRAYTASPLCSPTRSSILTGLHPARTGLTAPNCHTPKIIMQAKAAEVGPPAKKLTSYDSVTRLDPKFETLSERFQADSYTTAHFGKWHLGAEPYSPLEHGFDIDIPHWHGPGPAGSFVAPWKFKNFKEKYPKEHIEDRMGDEAVAFMEAKKDEPFFLNYWQFSVHAPFDAKAKLIEKYRSKIDPNDAQRSPTYAAMVQSLDDNVGKMLDTIDRLGIADNTIIIFFSDNGGNMYNEVDGTTPTSNRPLRGGKATSWEGGVRVPAVVVWPGQVEAGSRSNELITSTDFYPTLLEMCGLTAAEQALDGISITPALAGKALDRDAIFTHFPHSPGVPDTLPPCAAIYQDDWKLIRFFHDGPDGVHRHALYHLSEDIGEQNDLSIAEPEQTAAMAKRLDEFMVDTKAVIPNYNPNYNPGSPALTGRGLKAGKGCELSIEDGRLAVRGIEANPQMNYSLKPPVGPGEMVLQLKLKAEPPGFIDLRWSEKGVTPLFFKSRREKSKPYPAGELTTVQIPFSAKNPLTGFRIDLVSAAGTTLVDQISLLRDGVAIRSLNFNEKVVGVSPGTPPPGLVWVDLAGQFRRAGKPGPPQVERRLLVVGGEERDGIFQHANGPGQPISTISFPIFQFPELKDGVEGITLRTAIGFKDGETFVSAKSDGCSFVISANGEEVFRKSYAKQSWEEATINLDRFAGKEVELKFQIEPLKNSAADWACWAEPALVLTGKPEAIEERLKVATTMPGHWPLKKLREGLIKPKRIFRKSDSLQVAVMDEHLDLAMATERLAAELGKPRAPLAPKIVVGEGAHPGNHALVKVLGNHGIAEAQFLAFPPEVKGGVNVEVAGDVIAATPIQKGAVAECKLFSLEGEHLKTIKPEIAAPFVLASGDFAEAAGEELIIASSVGGKAKIYSQAGDELGSLMIPIGKTTLSTKANQLMVYTDELRKLSIFGGKMLQEVVGVRDLKYLPGGRRVFETVFDDERLWAGGTQPTVSHVYEIKADDSYLGKNVGQEENQFWIGLPKEFEQVIGKFENKAKAKHIRLATYGHIRVDTLTPRYRDPEKGEWGGQPVLGALKVRGLLKPLSQQPLRMWNPTFAHRQFAQVFYQWAEQLDEASGLNRFLQQSPEGGMDGYGQWDKKIHISSTYAPRATAMQNLYTKPLRTFLRNWAPLYRQQPWLAPSIEPNHELESVVATHAGVGDYNPHMITGFFDWLVQHYGDNPAEWEKRFGVRFEEFFDAPRGLGRASWDRYDRENPWLQAWVEFNRHVINRMLAVSYREALAAGLPPEMIRCHQIPDRYAIGGILNGISRITPIDYAMTAGVGFGFTKFGTNYDKPSSIIKAAHTSGFDSFVMGEFQPLSTDPVPVEKELRYVFGHGAKAIHPLYWSTTHTRKGDNPDNQTKNETLHAALQNLISEDPPRCGQAGGIGQVRAYRDGDRKFNIVSVGAGAGNRGLIKSVRADGKMEGTVYVVPFHQHVRIDRLKVVGNRISIPAEISPGSQVEIQGVADGKTSVHVYRGDTELADLQASFDGDWRFVLRLPERIDDLSFQLKNSEGNLKSVTATLQSPQAADVHRLRHEGIPHKGSVTFDLVD